MSHHVLAQAGSSFAVSSFTETIITYLVVLIGLFFVSLYIFRAIFNIPSFLRYQRAQIRLLEEIAKHQGVDQSTVKTIITESYGWDGAPSSGAQNDTQA